MAWQLIATTNAAAMVLLQFEIADDGTTNGWFSKCGSWFRLDFVWHRPVLGQLPVMSQEIFRVHVSLQGLVLGDTFRRLLSRTLAQTFGAAFDAACAPHQFALSTRAGAEALTRAVRARLALDDHRKNPQPSLVKLFGPRELAALLCCQ